MFQDLLSRLAGLREGAWKRLRLVRVPGTCAVEELSSAGQAPVLSGVRKKGRVPKLRVLHPAFLRFRGPESRYGAGNETAQAPPAGEVAEQLLVVLEETLLEFDALQMATERAYEGQAPEGAPLPPGFSMALAERILSAPNPPAPEVTVEAVERAWGIELEIWPDAQERWRLLRHMRRARPFFGRPGAIEAACEQVFGLYARLEFMGLPCEGRGLPEPSRLERERWGRVEGGVLVGGELPLEDWAPQLHFMHVPLETYEALAPSLVFSAKILDLAARFLPIHIQLGVDAEQLRQRLRWTIRRDDQSSAVAKNRLAAGLVLPGA